MLSAVALPVSTEHFVLQVHFAEYPKNNNHKTLFQQLKAKMIVGIIMTGFHFE